MTGNSPAGVEKGTMVDSFRLSLAKTDADSAARKKKLNQKLDRFSVKRK